MADKGEIIIVCLFLMKRVERFEQFFPFCHDVFKSRLLQLRQSASIGGKSLRSSESPEVYQLKTLKWFQAIGNHFVLTHSAPNPLN